jgi:transposase
VSAREADMTDAGTVTMSAKELDRLEVLGRVVERRVTQRQAAERLGLGERQVRRLCRALSQQGAAGLVSRKRGRPSNRKLPAAVREHALGVVRARYADFGPTLAREKLWEHHGVAVSTETLRQWMIDAGLWVPRSQRSRRVHQPRHRRSCLGELVQIDGCEHAWFEDRGPKCTLLVYVDDATSRLMELRFVASESAFDYFASTRAYLERYGKPVAFYSDRASIFRVTASEAKKRPGITQFGRALSELNIDILCANTPQAKAYASHCTSCVGCRATSGAAPRRRRRPPLCLFLTGTGSPGGSYRHCPLSLYAWARRRPLRRQTSTVSRQIPSRSAISPAVNMPASRSRS